LADELYPKLVEHYAHEANVRVIVDRRRSERRVRRAGLLGVGGSAPPQRRVLRDRRRARVPGDFPPLARLRQR
jgi:hypothetical protein